MTKPHFTASYKKPNEAGPDNWVAIGVGWVSQGRVKVVLDALPLPAKWDGTIWLFPTNQEEEDEPDG